MPLLIVGAVRLPPENLAEAKNAMSAMIAASRGEDGCLDYAYAEDVADPGLIRVSELWRDWVALARHFATPHLATWRATWPRLSISDRDLVLYEVGNPEPVSRVSGLRAPKCSPHADCPPN